MVEFACSEMTQDRERTGPSHSPPRATSTSLSPLSHSVGAVVLRYEAAVENTMDFESLMFSQVGVAEF
jgi:hypothetical protein